MGHVNKPHGTKGEVFVWPLTDHPEEALALGVVVHVAGDEGDAPDPDRAPLRIVGVRPFRRGLLVSFGGVGDRDMAERLRDLYLVRPTAELAPAEGDELFYHELIGMEVFTVQGERVGAVEEVYELKPAHMLSVRTAAGEVMIPFAKELVVDVDRSAGRMTIDPPEGLLDL